MCWRPSGLPGDSGTIVSKCTTPTSTSSRSCPAVQRWDALCIFFFLFICDFEDTEQSLFPLLRLLVVILSPGPHICTIVVSPSFRFGVSSFFFFCFLVVQLCCRVGQRCTQIRAQIRQVEVALKRDFKKTNNCWMKESCIFGGGGCCLGAQRGRMNGLSPSLASADTHREIRRGP